MNQEIFGHMPERRRPTRVADELSPERMARYLPLHFRGVIDKLPPPTSPEACFAWTLAMRYAIRINGRGWFKSQAQMRLTELMAITQEEILEMARTDPEFIAEHQKSKDGHKPEAEARVPEAL